MSKSELCPMTHASSPGKQNSRENRLQRITDHDIKAKKSVKTKNSQDIVSMFTKIANQKKTHIKCSKNEENVQKIPKNQHLSPKNLAEKNFEPTFPKICLQTTQRGEIKDTSSKPRYKAHPNLSPSTLNLHPPQDQSRGLKNKGTKSKLPPEFKYKQIQTYFKPTITKRLEESDIPDRDEPSSPKTSTNAKIKVDAVSSLLPFTD